MYLTAVHEERLDWRAIYRQVVAGRATTWDAAPSVEEVAPPAQI